MSLLNALFRTAHRKKYADLEHIPGPKPVFPIGNLGDLLGGEPLWQVLGRYCQEYGPISVMWIVGRPSVVLNCPDAIAHALLNAESLETEHRGHSAGQEASGCPYHQGESPTQADFYKDLPRKALLPMLTDNSPFEARDEGEQWTRLSNKDPFNQPYFPDWLSSQVHPLQELLETRAAELVGRSELGELPTYTTLQQLTFDGFSLAVDGQLFSTEIYDEFNLMCKTGTSRMSLSTTLGNWAISTEPKGKDYRQASQQWFDLFAKVVEHSKAGGGSTQSLLQWMRKYSSEQFTETELRDYCAGIYPGGSVSVPSAIASALYLLSQNPEKRASLLTAIDELMSEPLTYSRLNDCFALEQVMREALRLNPPVPFFTRNVSNEKSVKLGGYEIPAGTQLLINNWYLHRDPTYWEHPEEFIPERWDAATIEANPFGSGYFFPFGRGKRACIGQDFAQYFIKMALAVLLSKLEVQFGKDSSDEPEFYFAVSVPRKLKSTFKYRSFPTS
ncbi:MAG: cytochrome P450 [Synechococcus sp.]